MTDDTALVPVDVDALLALPVGDERVDALATAYQGWRRIDTRVAWAFGCGLDTVRGDYCKGDWGAILDRIGIEPRKARRYIQIARGIPSGQIDRYATVDAALDACKAKRIGPPEPAPAAAPAPAVLEADPAAVVESVAAEHEREHPPAPVVVDEEAEIEVHRRRHRADVATIKAQARTIAALKRKDRDVCDSLLASPTCPNCDNALARFWNKARPKS